MNLQLFEHALIEDHSVAWSPLFRGPPSPLLGPFGATGAAGVSCKEGCYLPRDKRGLVYPWPLKVRTCLFIANLGRWIMGIPSRKRAGPDRAPGGIFA